MTDEDKVWLPNGISESMQGLIQADFKTKKDEALRLQREEFESKEIASWIVKDATLIQQNKEISSLKEELKTAQLDILKECKKRSIGIITFGDLSDYHYWLDSEIAKLEQGGKE